MQDKIPARMYTSEVLALARFSRATMRERQRNGTFPAPIDRGAEHIYSGPDVYRALKLTDGPAPDSGDRIMRALDQVFAQ